MLIWIGLVIMFIASGLLYIRRYVPSELKTWGIFIAATLINCVCFELMWYNPVLQNDIQFWVDLIFISSILQQVWFGAFRWTYTAAAIIFEYLIYQALHLILPSYFGNNITPEIPFALANAAFSLVLLFQMTLRSRRFYKNYRFWLIFNSAAYYTFGLIAFLMEFNSVGSSAGHIMMNTAITLHITGFCISVISVLLSMALWFSDPVGDEEMSEIFLLPGWVERRIGFWEVPRISAHKNIKANSQLSPADTHSSFPQ